MAVSVNFDGVIHAYGRGWGDGTIYDPPLTDAFKALRRLMQQDAIFILTTRNPIQVARWIKQQAGDIECTTRLPRTWWGKRKPFWNTRGVLLVTNTKLAANIYIDDRGYRFESWDKTQAYLNIEL